MKFIGLLVRSHSTWNKMKLVVPFFLIMLLTACRISSEPFDTGTPTASFEFAVPTETLTPTPTPEPTDSPFPSETPDTRLTPDRWKEWPVVPIIDPEMKLVFQHGLETGNHPNEFTKIGDGEISTVWFLTQYDFDPSQYHLGSHTDLLPVIKQFSGSFKHISLAAGRGFNTTIILGLVPADTPGCHPGDTRLDCEIRLYMPSFALISLGTNQVWQPEVFKPGLQKIIDVLLKAGIIPILSTKADNLEGNYRINQTIAQLAYDNHLPLWNFWLAVQPLPNHGLQPDREHLTYSYSDFSNPINFLYAWPWRNLTALQVLNSIFSGVSNGYK